MTKIGRAWSVDGATEHHAGFQFALIDILEKYPELRSASVSFDGLPIPLDSVFQYEAGELPQRVMHGTSEAAWRGIQQSGLQPRAASGAEAAYGRASSAKAGRIDAVYLTTQRNMAHFAARDAGAATHTAPLVLDVQTRALQPRLLVPDEDSRAADWRGSLERLGSVGYRGTIPASALSPREILTDREWQPFETRQANPYLTNTLKSALKAVGHGRLVARGTSGTADSVSLAAARGQVNKGLIRMQPTAPGVYALALTWEGEEALRGLAWVEKRRPNNVSRAAQLFSAFHSRDPERQWRASWRGPAELHAIGRAQVLYYSSDKVDPSELQDPGGVWKGYYHDHDPDTRIYLPPAAAGRRLNGRRPADVLHLRWPEPFIWLGSADGYKVEIDGRIADVKLDGKRGMKGLQLWALPDASALVAAPADGGREDECVVWYGPALTVQHEGVEG